MVLKYEKIEDEDVYYSISSGNLNVLEAFLEKGFDLNKYTYLIRTLATYKKDGILLILNNARKYGHPIDLYKKFETYEKSCLRGKTLAEVGVRLEKLDIIEALEEYGVNVRDYLLSNSLRGRYKKA